MVWTFFNHACPSKSQEATEGGKQRSGDNANHGADGHADKATAANRRGQKTEQAANHGVENKSGWIHELGLSQLLLSANEIVI